MSAISTLAVATLLISHAAFAATPEVTPERRVVLASNAARALIVEARAEGQFWFEHCYFPNSATKTVTQELLTSDYKDCVEISRPLPDNESTRAEFNLQFHNLLNDTFEQHSRFAAVSHTVLAGAAGTFVGMLLPMLPIRYINTTSVRRIAAGALASGSVAALLTYRYSVDHMDELGLGREVEDSLDSDLAGDVILLDEQTKVPRHARQAIGVFEMALDAATASTISKQSN